MKAEIRQLLTKEEEGQEILVELTVTSPFKMTILLRHFVRPRVTYWLRTLSLHRGARLAERNDYLTLCKVDKVERGFCLHLSTELRRHSQISLPITTPIASEHMEEPKGIGMMKAKKFGSI